MASVLNKYSIDSSSDATSRYRRLYRIQDSYGDEYQESSEKMEIDVTSSDQYHKVMPGEENRLDLISYKFYNTPLLWWCIAEASDIRDPLNVPLGTILRIPDKQTLYGYKGVLA